MERGQNDSRSQRLASLLDFVGVTRLEGLLLWNSVIGPPSLQLPMPIRLSTGLPWPPRAMLPAPVSQLPIPSRAALFAIPHADDEAFDITVSAAVGDADMAVGSRSGTLTATASAASTAGTDAALPHQPVSQSLLGKKNPWHSHGPWPSRAVWRFATTAWEPANCANLLLGTGPPHAPRSRLLCCHAQTRRAAFLR